jgi:ribosomal protein S18 acetylase RimI-like enzyme
MFDIHPAGDAWREAALDLLYQRLDSRSRARQVARAVAANVRGEISFDHLLVCRADDRLVSAVLAVVRPGRVAFLWPPAVEGGDSSPADCLLQALSSRLDEAGVLFTQCLVEPADLVSSARLTRGGFPHVTDMLTLSCDVKRRNLRLRSGVDFVEYTPAAHSRFVRLFERTCEESRDCPILSKVRAGAEALEAHRATGVFRPAWWQILRSNGVDAGLLLLADHPERRVCELVYLGVSAEFRRRRLAWHCIEVACDLAASAGRQMIEVAVDAQNEPAVALYRKAGFNPCERYAVHLRLRAPGFEGANSLKRT